MIPLPTELLESIIDNLHDKPTLLSCALVGKAWVSASQRGVFTKLVLKAPSSQHEDFEELFEAYLAANKRLLLIFDENPRIPTYIRSLELLQFDKFERTRLPVIPQVNSEEFHASTARVISRLSNVENLLFLSVNWAQFSPVLKAAVVNLFSAPSITRVTLSMIAIPKFAELASLLGCIKNLKALKVSFLTCTDWDVPVPEESLEEDNALISMNPAPPKSIHLDQLLHFHSVNVRSFAAWFQQPSCPIEIQNLQSLQIHRSITFDYQGTAFMLELVGNSLRELELHGPFRSIHSNIVHLGYTPDLRSLSLVNVHQTDTYTPVPWIQSLFEPLLRLNQKTYPLQSLTIHLYADHSDPLSTHQWDEWSQIDALLAAPVFFPLEAVNIILIYEHSIVVKEKLTERFSLLAGLGKLRVEMPLRERRIRSV
ncbi:hypothetical protein BDP27DRAFT_1418698 [Rhodocollybia butyracea]|uniref:F-box domain-containing protein n=1 Tax=Rhodocollybia butyracea TaxID=206335 RepID=A0A9P5PXU5_9AGAR|nr:hypothetical protein BDP27DRAFT_1418698 [Rhodocollybia butyracea]